MEMIEDCLFEKLNFNTKVKPLLLYTLNKNQEIDQDVRKDNHIK